MCVASEKTGYYLIYTLSDPDSGAIRYVGQTARTLEVRLKFHCYDYKKTTHRGRWINSLRKRGVRPVIKEIDRVDENRWEAAEKKWIAHYRSLGCDLVNGSDGGEGSPGWVATPEFRKRMSDAHKGVPLSEEHKKKIGQAHKGRIISQETREKVSAFFKGRPISEAHRLAISKGNKGRVVSAATKVRLSQLAKERWADQEFRDRVIPKLHRWQAGIPLAEETKEKLRAALLGRPRPAEVVAKTVATKARMKLAGVSPARVTSAETKIKIRNSLVGKPRPPEVIAKIIATKARKKLEK